jgi:hypothetical protein
LMAAWSRSQQNISFGCLWPMQATRKSRERIKQWGLAASLVFHIVLVAALLLAPAVSLPPFPPEESVAVEIITLPPPGRPIESTIVEKTLVPSKPVEAAAVPLKSDAAAVPTPAAPQTVQPSDLAVHATQFFSDNVLANPRSKGVRTALAHLSPDERIVQLCNIEAMAQVHKWRTSLQPDNLVAYALADPKVSAHGITANGGAFRAKKHWYGLRFKCDTTVDLKRVAAFDFTVGAEIPKAEWSRHYLTVDDGAAE